MKKLGFAAIFIVLIFTLTACVGRSESHQPIPIVPPNAPVYMPAPTPRPTPRPVITGDTETAPEYDVPPLPPLIAATMTQGVRTADFNEITATRWVANIGMGWNLGNTLDSHGGLNGFDWLGGGLYANTTVAEMEYAWVNHITTRENIQAVADAGFNTIRIPVTWFKALQNEMHIREDWMARVQEIVDWSLDAGLKVILNTHHDEYIFDLRDEFMHYSKASFIMVWKQIAYHFRDYNEMLMFEGLNEPRTIGSPAEWTGGTAEERANLNILNQLFVDIVRANGGNNAYRVLMVPTYAASSAAVAQRALVIPTDTVDDRIVVSLHIYAPWEFALRTGPVGTRDTWDAENPAEVTPITEPLQLAYELFVSQGFPVIIGEMGALNRDNEAIRAEWAYFFVSYARSLGMPSVWWDNGMTGVTAANPWGGWDETFGLIHRPTNTIVHQQIVDALMRAVR
ncbi:MAG: glycoside hydrolase family 5 protein [Defluviitaleaceae bacterium]|nr:glycoside hydrolase family 5 protein [Defluviitaleaceae bacterium]MCL2274702.1 glycoside hydrolase family 5 protein [Defluviitaleaceae bacterium]